MADFQNDFDRPRKRRRRFHAVKRPVSALLSVDEELRGATGVISDDLWADLCQSDEIQDGEEQSQNGSRAISYVAISPWTPPTEPADELSWTILPVKRGHLTAHSSLHIPPASTAFQAFRRTNADLHSFSPNKPIEIRLADVQPLLLDTVIVTVERNLLQNVDEIQKEFGGGFHAPSKTKSGGKSSANSRRKDWKGPPSQSNEDRLTAICREALSRLEIVHSGDVFDLPLPSHPITHVPPPPAVVAACEPASQGFLCPRTKIILIQAGSSPQKAVKILKTAMPIAEEVIEDETEDTSNEQFFSAAEDRSATSSSELDGSAEDDESDRDTSSRDHSDDASDDSLDDIISLAAPGLPPQPSGTLSAMTSATPRPGGRKNGTHSPGSVYSNYSSSTARAGSRPGKLFRTEVLLRPYPIELLHPRPSIEDDNDSFVFVDIGALAKMGCFSGDWARLEAVKRPQAGTSSLDLGGLSGLAEDAPDWRPVRVFGLPGLAARSPRYAIDKSGDRRSSLSHIPPLALTPTVLIPPILLCNLGETQFVKLSPQPTSSVSKGVSSQHKSTLPSLPPFAKEVTLRKILTPLATLRDLEQTVLSGLKRHFESKRRLVKLDDLIAIPVDEELGKATAAPGKSAENGVLDDEYLQNVGVLNDNKSRKIGVAWFCIDRIDLDPAEYTEALEDKPWAGSAIIDVTSHTKMSQVGSRMRRIPSLAQQSWQYWFGLKRLHNIANSMVASSSPIADIPRPLALPLEKRLADLVSAATSTRAISLRLPPLVILLHSTQRQVGKSYTATAACALAGVHTFSISGHDILSEGASTTGGGDVKSEAILTSRAERAFTCGAQYTALLIQHIDVLTADRMVPALQDIIAEARVVIATTTEIEKIADGIRSLFTHELEITAPNESEREIIMKNICLEQSLRLDSSVDLSSVALKTAALVAGDLRDVVNRASLARRRRLENLAADQQVSSMDILFSGGPATTNILSEDFDSAILDARSTFSDSIGAPKIPSVTWNDVGGLADQKSSIMETISLPLSRPELFAKGMRKRSGILFYGPPGTGKTLLAKAIATEFSLNFFSVKGPELLNMYIGESEANVRRVFQRARDARPCVVFFDELDSVAPKRGNQGDSGGVMDRIVSQLLAELDGMSSGSGSSEDNDEIGASGNASGVFVIGATNRPDLLDPALLRPGRFDKMLYLGVSSTHEQQVTILQALTRKFKLASDVSLTRIAEKLPFTYTGADLYALCSDAMLKAISRKTQIVDEKVKEASLARGEAISTAYFFDHLARPEDLDVVVREEDFLAAQRELVASVSAKELEHFERIRKQFEQEDLSKSNSLTKQNPRAQAPLPHRPNHAQSTQHQHPPHQPIPGQVSTNKPKIDGKAVLQSKGKAKLKGIANPDSGPGSDSDDDEYIIKTNHLNGSLTGAAGGSGGSSSNHNGKHRGKARLDDFLVDSSQDEDLYS